MEKNQYVNSKRTESHACQLAYPGGANRRINILKPLEEIMKLPNRELKIAIYKKDVVDKYLKKENPFLLESFLNSNGEEGDLGNSSIVISRDHIENAFKCLWDNYFSVVDTNASRRRNEVQQQMLDFVNDYLKGGAEETKSWQFKLAQIRKQCSSLLDAKDIFAKCIGPQCIEQGKLYQPHILQSELTKYDRNLKRIYNSLLEKIAESRADLKNELANKFPSRNIAYITSPKFSAMLTHVPHPVTHQIKKELDGQLNGARPENTSSTRREKWTQKKRRQKLQQILINTVAPKGQVENQYKSLFVIEKPFEVAREGKVVHKSTGSMRGAYARNQKQLQVHLRFKVNHALNKVETRIAQLKGRGLSDTEQKEYNDLKRKLKLLLELKNANQIDRPLKLRPNYRTGGYRVLAGGNRSDRNTMKLFGVIEFKKKPHMTQMYRFTEKTKDVVQRYVNSDDETSIKLGIKVITNTALIKFKEFKKQTLRQQIDILILKYLEYIHIAFSRPINWYVSAEMQQDERFDLPFVSSYRFSGFGKQYDFIKHHRHNLNDIIFYTTSVSNISDGTPTFSYTLSFDDLYQTDFLSFDKALQKIRQHIRTNPSLLVTSPRIAKFFLKNEDKGRMSPIGKIVNLIRNSQPGTVKRPKAPSTVILPRSLNQATVKNETPNHIFPRPPNQTTIKNNAPNNILQHSTQSHSKDYANPMAMMDVLIPEKPMGNRPPNQATIKNNAPNNILPRHPNQATIKSKAPNTILPHSTQSHSKDYANLMAMMDVLIPEKPMGNRQARK